MKKIIISVICILQLLAIFATSSYAAEKPKHDLTFIVTNNTNEFRYHDICWIDHPFGFSSCSAVWGATLVPGESQLFVWENMEHRNRRFYSDWVGEIFVPAGATELKIFRKHFIIR